MQISKEPNANVLLIRLLPQHKSKWGGKIGRGGQTGAYVCPLKWSLLIFLLPSIKIINVLSLHDIVQKMTCQMEHYELWLWPLSALHSLSPLIKINQIDQIMETACVFEKANKTIQLPVIRFCQVIFILSWLYYHGSHRRIRFIPPECVGCFTLYLPVTPGTVSFITAGCCDTFKKIQLCLFSATFKVPSPSCSSPGGTGGGFNPRSLCEAELFE